MSEVKEQVSMYEQTMTVKDEMIISLTNQNQQISPGESPTVTRFLTDPMAMAIEREELDKLKVVFLKLFLFCIFIIVLTAGYILYCIVEIFCLQHFWNIKKKLRKVDSVTWKDFKY